MRAKTILAAAMTLFSVTAMAQEVTYEGFAQNNLTMGVNSNGHVDLRARSQNLPGWVIQDVLPITVRNFQAGVSDTAYLRFESEIPLVGAHGYEPNSTRLFVVPPLMGNLHMYPSRNNMGHGFSDGTSVDGSYGGLGFSIVRTSPKETYSYGVRGTLSHVSVSEMLPDGYHTEAGADQQGRQTDNTVDATGTNFNLTAEFNAIDKALLGIALNSKRLVGEGSTVRYYDHESRLYAKVNLKKKGRMRVKLYGEYLFRKNNLTDLGNGQMIQVFSTGLDLQLTGQPFRR